MSFYDVKNKQTVEVADMLVVAKSYTRETAKGTKTSYALTGTTPDGRNLTKFCSREVFIQFGGKE